MLDPPMNPDCAPLRQMGGEIGTQFVPRTRPRTHRAQQISFLSYYLWKIGTNGTGPKEVASYLERENGHT